MSAAAALAGLRTAGVRVRLGGGGAISLDATAPPRAELLAFARLHRAGIVVLLRDEGQADVPPAWREGIALLAMMMPPCGIRLARWDTLAATSARLLCDRGAELHRAGWDALDVFGLHRLAPVANPTGWGLA